MSAAHTCTRSALAQAFRLSSNCSLRAFSISAFLVPALASLSNRPFNTRNNHTRHRRIHISRDDRIVTGVNSLPNQPTQEPLRPRIPQPQHEARGDIDQWLAAIEPFLPSSARRSPSSNPDISSTVTAFDLAVFLDQAGSIDIISHLGLVEGRWQAAVWIAKRVMEQGQRSVVPPLHLDAFEHALGSCSRNESLKTLTEHPICIEKVKAPRKLGIPLDDLTLAPDTIDKESKIIKRGIGQVWRSLGTLILAASERSGTADEKIMLHVLEIIAYLHHIGLMPESIYSYKPRSNEYMLQQPPTLHMLSSKILTALSDATWRAHEASVKAANDNGAQVSHFLGHQIPGSRYKAVVTGVAPELWLELVLWSCLHGGWILHGAAILERIARKTGDEKWGLISWREIMQAEKQETPTPSWAWSLFSRTHDVSIPPLGREKTRRTISCEVVSAFVDALVNHLRVGVGCRGTNPETIIELLKTLKKFLDAHNLSLGTASWDAIMVRILESGSLDPEKKPEILMRIVDLAPGFGAEVTAVNSSASADAQVPFFFEPTTVSLSCLHRAMRGFVCIGDVKGAMTALMLLQRLTDDNKQRSVQQFFETLRNTPTSEQDQLFASRLPPVDFPAFDTRLPVTLLARLLDLITDSKLYDVGRWLLFSDDLDGPLINAELRSHRNMAASVVRLGTLSGDNDLVLEIIKKVGYWNSTRQQQRMPAEVLIALLCCQLKLHRWESVRGMQNYVEETMTFRPRPIIFSTFAAELLRIVKDTNEVKEQAKEAFSNLLFGWEQLCMRNIRNELYCIISILSSVDSEWEDFCSTFLAISWQQTIRLSTDDFNRVLGGVLDGYGSLKGKQITEKWCYQSPNWFAPYRAPGGLPTMPRYRIGKAQEIQTRPPKIELVQKSGSKFVLQGRIHANRLTVLAIIRKAQEEIAALQQTGEEMVRTTRAEIRETTQWAAQMLFYLGYDQEDIFHSLGSRLAEIAELPPPTTADNDVHDENVD